MLSARGKVEHWLDSQVQLNGGRDGGDNCEDDHNLKVVETWNIRGLDHFSVSKSGALGIASFPYLSVIPSGKIEVSHILESNAEKYFSSTFVSIEDKEYLAMAYSSSIRLWDIENDTTKTVYTLEACDKKLCVIDDRTMACATFDFLQDGLHRIYIININAAVWSLGSTILVEGGSPIRDLCFNKASDGSPLLVLCRPESQMVHAVELVGGRRRWENGKEQMGEKWYPYSVSVDTKNNVFVADSSQHKIHVLSADDGLLYMSINLRPHGITKPTIVRVLDENIYVGYWDRQDRTQISKIC